MRYPENHLLHQVGVSKPGMLLGRRVDTLVGYRAWRHRLRGPNLTSIGQRKRQGCTQPLHRLPMLVLINAAGNVKPGRTRESVAGEMHVRP